MEILIVDDSPTSRMLLKTVLGKLGYGVVVSVHGIPASDIIERIPTGSLPGLWYSERGVGGFVKCGDLPPLRFFPALSRD